MRVALLMAAAIALGVVPGRAAGPLFAGPARAGNRGPARLEFSPDGRRVFVSEGEEGTVAAIDARTMQVERRLPSGGEQPNGLAVTADGRTLLVANSLSGSVGIVDVATGRLRSVLPLPGVPWDVRASPDGRTAYVSVSQLDQVAVLDLAAGREVARIGTGRRPRALALSEDGRTLVCANMAEGSLSLLDPTARREVKRVPLDGVNVRGLALHPDGKAVYATLQPPLNRRPTSYTFDIWHNFVREVKLAGAESERGEEQWMDFGATASPEQEGIAIRPDGRRAYVAVSGRHSVAEITLREKGRLTIWPLSFRETRVGAAPRGVALSPDGSRLWVACSLANSVAVLDTATLEVVRSIDLGPATRVDPSVEGRYLFGSARLGRNGRFSCNACHPDGSTDGLTWRFTHVPDGMERRNTRDLRGGVPGTAPFRWSGHDTELGDFIQEEVTGLLQGPRLGPDAVAAIGRAVSSFRLPPNPHREASGELTEAGRHGEALFSGKAGCAACHGGAARGGTGLKAWIGTTPQGRALDVPHLVGVYDSAPYLHDGRAPTLESIFREHDGSHRHGSAHRLSEAELADLLSFVRQL